MTDLIEKYLNELKAEMKHADIATRQDALGDAEDHLTSALAEMTEVNPGLDQAEAVASIIEEYGSPRETAESYMDLEKRFTPGGQTRTYRREENARGRFFAIFRDTAAWGSVLYCLLSLVTGIVYFTWSVTGIAVSASMMVLIIGIPIAVGFFFSFHGLAFLEGRIIEGLLGVRMPRRQRFFDADMKWGDKVKRLLLKPDSWMFILYQIIMLPLGIIYFTLVVTLFSISIASMASPFAAVVLELVLNIDNIIWGISPWFLPVVAVAGFFLLKGSLHLFKNIGKMHGQMAKAMLISRAD